MEERLTKAIAKLEKKMDSVPLDERVADNRDYTKIINLVTTFKNFKATLARLDPMLTELGC